MLCARLKHRTNHRADRAEESEDEAMKKTILCLLLTLGLLLLSAAAMAASDPDNYFFDMMEGNITIEDADTSEMVKVTYGNPQTTTAEFDPQEHVITVGGSISPNPLQLSINTTVP